MLTWLLEPIAASIHFHRSGGTLPLFVLPCNLSNSSNFPGGPVPGLVGLPGLPAVAWLPSFLAWLPTFHVLHRIPSPRVALPLCPKELP